MTFDKNSSYFAIYLEISEFKRQTNCRYTERTVLLKCLKILLNTDAKIIFLDQNNYVRRSSIDDYAAKNFNILAIGLNVLHNYFDPNKIIFRFMSS